MSIRRLLAGLTVASCLLASEAIAQKVITLWHPYNAETDMIHYGIKTFNESQKDYRIEARLVPYTQLTAEMIKAVATGTPPDLVTLNDPVVAQLRIPGPVDRHNGADKELEGDQPVGLFQGTADFRRVGGQAL